MEDEISNTNGALLYQKYTTKSRRHIILDPVDLETFCSYSFMCLCENHDIKIGFLLSTKKDKEIVINYFKKHYDLKKRVQMSSLEDFHMMSQFSDCKIMIIDVDYFSTSKNYEFISKITSDRNKKSNKLVFISKLGKKQNTIKRNPVFFSNEEVNIEQRIRRFIHFFISLLAIIWFIMYLYRLFFG